MKGSWQLSSSGDTDVCWPAVFRSGSVGDSIKLTCFVLCQLPEILRRPVPDQRWLPSGPGVRQYYHATQWRRSRAVGGLMNSDSQASGEMGMKLQNGVVGLSHSPQTAQTSLGTHGCVKESVAHWVALVFLLLLFLSFFFRPSMWARRRLE